MKTNYDLKIGDMDVDIVCDKFIEFVESNGWSYGSGFCEVDEAGNEIGQNKNE